MRYVLVMNRNIPPDFRYNTLKKAKRTYYTPFLNLVTKKNAIHEIYTYYACNNYKFMI